MKRFVQCISLVLVLSMCLATPVFAKESSSRASNFFGSRSAYLWETSGTSFQVWFDVQAVSIMDEIGASVIKVQRSSNGESWSTMKTYTKESYTNLIDYNTSTHASYVTYTGTSGYYYRAYVELYAKDGVDEAYYGYYTSSILL